MRPLTLFTLAALAINVASAQANGKTLVLGGPGAIQGLTFLELGYHVNVQHRLVAFETEGSPEKVRFLGSVSLSAEGLYQRGLANDGGPWLGGIGVVSRWDPAPPTWLIRPYAIPVTVGAFIEGGSAASDGGRSMLGLGNGIGVEVPIGSLALSVEARSLISIIGADGGGIPVSFGVRF